MRRAGRLPKQIKAKNNVIRVGGSGICRFPDDFFAAGDLLLL